MADMWTGLAVIIAILLLPIAIPVALFFINRDVYKKYGVWVWFGAGIVIFALLYLMMPMVL